MTTPAAGASIVSQAFPALAPAMAALPKPEGKALSYGTAGFRDRAELLDSTFQRMGVLAALRSRSLGGATIGLMVTASHNAVQDNGVKMVDPHGGMLAMAWEGHACQLANAEGTEEELFAGVVLAICGSAGVDPKDWGSSTPPARVMVARDTRPHSHKLASLAIEGALLLPGTEVLDLGVLTTPQLHHCVRMENALPSSSNNTTSCPSSFVDIPGIQEAWKGEGGYATMLASAFVELVKTAETADDKEEKEGSFDNRLWVDCAHGVGALKILPLIEAIDALREGGEKLLELRVVNGVGDGTDDGGKLLNEGCGAEFVQKGQTPPKGQDKERDRGKRWASLDGDADRLVYHYVDTEGAWHLLDGDKLAALCASFLMEELVHFNQARPLSKPDGKEEEEEQVWRVVVVQTAYANGASTRYLHSQHVPVVFAKTGVKFVHHAAEQYDLGVYFEANGHGTVLFSDPLVQALLQQEQAFQADAALRTAHPRAHLATRRLLLARQLINQAVGDALSDLLFIEAVLRLKGWGVAEWDKKLYTDLPSKQLKLRVADRVVVTCSDDETRALTPAELQPALDAAMGQEEQGRCFVRPSGTEDVVRIYAEAATQEGADRLARAAAGLVYDMCGGVGATH